MKRAWLIMLVRTHSQWALVSCPDLPFLVVGQSVVGAPPGVVPKQQTAETVLRKGDTARKSNPIIIDDENSNSTIKVGYCVGSDKDRILILIERLSIEQHRSRPWTTYILLR